MGHCLRGSLVALYSSESAWRAQSIGDPAAERYVWSLVNEFVVRLCAVRLGLANDWAWAAAIRKKERRIRSEKGGMVARAWAVGEWSSLAACGGNASHEDGVSHVLSDPLLGRSRNVSSASCYWPSLALVVWLGHGVLLVPGLGIGCALC